MIFRMDRAMFIDCRLAGQLYFRASVMVWFVHRFKMAFSCLPFA